MTHRCIPFKFSARLLLTLSLLSAFPWAVAQATNSIGVVYLNTNTPNPDAAWISRGLADMLTTDLSKIKGLTVVQREQLDKVLKEQALATSGAVDLGKAAQLGKLLGAQTLLTGSYAAIGRNVRVDLQLVNTTTGQVEAGVTAEGSIDSIFSLEKQLVLSVISKLGLTPNATELQAILQTETFNNQAVILNYQGLTQLNTDPKAASVTLRQAVALDPNYMSAQQNLRTALSLSGTSLANTAIIDLELKSKEIQVARQVAELIKKAIVIDSVKLGTPSTRSDEPDMATIKYTASISLRPGTVATMVKMLEPFSREGENRTELTLYGQGIGRNDKRTLFLAGETYSFLVDYLGKFEIWHAFYGIGEQPVYLNLLPVGYPNSLSVSKFIEYPSSYNEKSVEREFDRLKIPISTLKNVLSSSALVLDAYDNDREADLRYIHLDERNARELGVPSGYLREAGRNEQDVCYMETSTGRQRLNFSSLKSMNDIEALSGVCVVYTKIDDGDFEPNKLKMLLESGQSYNITYYATDEKKFNQRTRYGLTYESTWNYKGYGLEFKVTSQVLRSFNSLTYRIEVLKDIPRDTTGFSSNELF